MLTCPSCNAEQSDASRFCSQCGCALSPEFAATVVHGDNAAANDSSDYSSPSDSSHHGMFLPGTRVADRYRIVSLVGKGGMGEVYRADDLKLGHTVALKFLPRDLAEDPHRLEYFHSEVRLTRQISHPNVCRVYDIGEADGQQFLSMEYIDGEDLKVLLRRIGRLPQDKGIQIARQLCEGLAAAHAKGVLHRDLKPANIMIDGHGQVRITDFGLATLEHKSLQPEIAGTPAYMAPEQIKDGQTTAQSDLYSLGLILYELFTGAAVHKPGSVADLIQAHEGSSPSQPSNLVNDIDPAVERVILRCLQRDPQERPKSAHAVAAAFPGGDPLAAALAAGETPSPAMVAASGETGSLSLKNGLLCLTAVLLGLVALMFLSPFMQPTAAPNTAPPDEQQFKVQQKILAQLGYYEDNIRPTDAIYGLQLNPKGTRDWEFWYRQHSHGFLTPTISEISYGPKTYAISMTNPPMEAGMVSVRTDLEGNLIELFSAADRASLARDVDWRSELFALAGLSFDDFTEVPGAENLSLNRPPIHCDDVAVFRKTSHPSARVIVGRNDDRLAYFYTDPMDGRRVWTRQFVSADISKDIGNRSYHQLLQLIVLLPAIFLTLRNIRLGRADRKGGLCFAIWLGSMEIMIWVFGLHHVPSPMREWVLLRDFLREPWLAYTFRHWLYYMALEPYVRRYWPNVLITWSRAINGQFRDPLLGRHTLIGCVTGVMVWTMCTAVFASVASLTDHTRPFEIRFDVNSTLRPVTTVLFVLSIGASNAVFSLMLLFLLRTLLHDTRLAVAGYALLNVGVFALDGKPPIELLVVALWCVGLGLSITRFGLMAGIAFLLTQTVLEVLPVTTHITSWYGGGTLVAFGSVLVVAAYGFYTSTLSVRHLIAE